LIHGGVRYLQKAIMKLDYEQVRSHLACSCEPTCYRLPLIFQWWQLPYYWAGIKMYDVVAGIHCLKSSYLLSKSKALEYFPMLNKDKLVGAIVYYDGQHNDARMNLAIALTAARHGAAIANYTEVVHLLKTKNQKTGREQLCGAHYVLTGKEFDVRAKCVINATGPFTDSLRQMDKQETAKICQPSAGVHIVMPGYYSPDSMGLLDPATSDGRVIFFLPWEKMTIAGTTDTPTDVTAHPIPREDDIDFILREVRNYLSPDVEGTGLGSLASAHCPSAGTTLSASHSVCTGGKWTTYRAMAQETIDAAVKFLHLPARPCRTVGLMLEGAKGWTPTLYIRLVQDYGLEEEVAQHLATAYGGKAFDVAKMAQVTGQRWPIVGKRLVSEFPYIEAEVLYAIKEYACTAIDVMARRTRLGFLNVQAADEALPRIVQIMGKELNWSQEKRTEELEAAKMFLYHEMGYRSRSERLIKSSEIHLDYQDVMRYKNRFHKFDKESKGFITTVDVQRVLESINVHIDENALHEILNEVDLNKNGQVEFNEFLRVLYHSDSGSQPFRNKIQTVKLGCSSDACRWRRQIKINPR
uniref:Glycerol-3-phosphate dehydrogenase, mitochondrial n=1 Tax=Poecilia mexicana TaxID=48701 RepID=A0A3B3XRT8_9TELE